MTLAMRVASVAWVAGIALLAVAPAAAAAGSQEQPPVEQPDDDPADDLPDGARTIVGSPDPGPKPEHSGERGGWAQLLVLGVMAGGVGFVAWRVSRAIRTSPSGNGGRAETLEG